MFRLSDYFKSARGFTILESLIAFTAFTVVLGGYWQFMQSQNREIKTVTQRSQADEATTMAIQSITGDIKSARREGVQIDNSGTNIGMFRFTVNPDPKKSDQLYIEKVEYRYDRFQKTLTRTAYNVDYNERSGNFDVKGVKDTKTFKNLTSVKFKKIPIPNMASSQHVLGVGIEAEAQIDNVLLGHPQKSFNQDIVYVKDEVAYHNQPHWNKNPIFSNKIVSLTLTPPLTLDFSSSLDIIKWANNLKTLVPGLLEDAGKTLTERVMVGLTGKVLDQANDLYSRFASDAAVNGMIANVRNNFMKTVYDKSNDPKLAAAAGFMKDVLMSGNAGAALKDKVLNRLVTDSDIENFLGANAHGMMDLTHVNNRLIDVGVISRDEWRYVQDFKNNAEHDQARYMAIIGKVKNQIYDGIGTADKFSQMVNNYSNCLTDKMRLELKSGVLSKVTGAVAQEIARIKMPEVSQLLKDSTGIKTVLEDPKLDPAAKLVLDGVLSLVDQGMNQLIGKVAQEASQKIISEVQSKFENMDDAITKASQNAPDMVNSTIGLMSKKFLVGEKYDEATKKFLPGANNYYKQLFDGFNLPTPKLDDDKAAQGLLDKFYAENNLNNPFK